MSTTQSPLVASFALEVIDDISKLSLFKQLKGIVIFFHVPSDSSCNKLDKSNAL
jgi:hypothetical protein